MALIIEKLLIMRRQREKQPKKKLNLQSPTSNDNLTSFKKVESWKGHSLMRRTQLSWDKLQEKQMKFSKEHQEPPNNKGEQYFSHKKPPPSIRDKLKKGGNKKLREKFSQRRKFCFKEQIKQKLQNEQPISVTPAKQPTSPNPDTHSQRKYFKAKNAIPVSEQRSKLSALKQRMKQRVLKQSQMEKYQLRINEDYQLEPANTIKRTQPCQIQPQNKSKQQLSTMSSLKNSILPLFSRNGSMLDCSATTANKITLHLEILGELASYSKQLLDTYEENSEWQELVFLVYKKYYVERVKVARSLRGIGFNPFHLNICTVGTGDLQSFRKTIEGIKLVKDLESQNKRIIDCLRVFYNMIIEKSGNHINMEERDDFTREILKDMAIEINLLKDIKTMESEQRLARVYRCAFLIAELEGNLIIGYEESLDSDTRAQYLQKASKLFHQCLIL